MMLTARERIERTPIPDRMLGLQRDQRGYPIPFIVQRGVTDLPHFAINDQNLRYRCASEDRCGICGQKLMRGRWFVGGPLSAFHKFGAYFDPPMHKECMEYAMVVCPYIAIASYNADKRSAMDRVNNKPKDLPDTAILIDETMIPGRPPVFVCVHARGQRITPNGHFVPLRPYIALQFWRHGEHITPGSAIGALYAAGESEAAVLMKAAIK
jgi:hypothetical protein